MCTFYIVPKNLIHSSVHESITKLPKRPLRKAYFEVYPYNIEGVANRLHSGYALSSTLGG